MAKISRLNMTTVVICILMALLYRMDADGKEIGSRVLSRKKRFLIFPVGSSLSIATCMTVGVYGNPQFSIFSWGLNYGFAYNLPSNSTLYTHIPEDLKIYPFYDPDSLTTTTTTEATTTTTESSKDSHEEHDGQRRKFYVYSQPKYESMPMMHRRYRRDVYRNVEAVIDKMGYNGRECLLRALCESSQIFDKRRRTMVQELIRTVFSMPKSNVLPFEHPDLVVYDKAFRSGQREEVRCERAFKCGFSLINMILGKYSKPEIDFM